jgi:hypothetical protein
MAERQIALINPPFRQILDEIKVWIDHRDFRSTRWVDRGGLL